MTKLVYKGRYQWDEADFRNRDIKWGECWRCGNEQFVLLAPNPFLEEIFPADPNPPVRWCCNCYTALCDEV